MAAASASGIPVELIGLLTPLPADGGAGAGRGPRAPGAPPSATPRASLADRGVLLAGDMLSDVLIPLLDPRQADQVDAYEAALDRLEEAAGRVEVLVPGHGAVAEGPEVAARLSADRAYLDALQRGRRSGAGRRAARAGLAPGPHRSNVEQARQHVRVRPGQPGHGAGGSVLVIGPRPGRQRTAAAGAV